MTGISSGIGLVSGLQYATLVEQLMKVEALPIRNLEQRAQAIDVQRAAFAELTAKLLSLKGATAPFGKVNFFRKFSASSSNEQIAVLNAGEKAKPGSYALKVHALVGTHSVISKGFADQDKSPVGAGKVSFEMGKGRVAVETPLALLNGGTGVSPGAVKITDRSGQSAVVDLSKAVTMQDVLDAIHSVGLGVKASVTSLPHGTASGDRIVLTDTTGATASNLIVADVGSTDTAHDLGIAGSTAESRLDGKGLLYLADSTPLALLNDGNGVDALFNDVDLSFSTTYGDFNVSLTDLLKPSTPLAILNSGNGVRTGIVRVTDRLGNSAEVNVSGAQTAQQVLDLINGTGLKVSAFIVNSQINIADLSGLPADAAATLKVEDVDGFAALDLGIAGASAGLLAGKSIYRVETIGDVLRAINHAPGNDNTLVRASLSPDGSGIQLESLGFGSTVTVSGAGSSTAAHDLGLLGAVFDGSGALVSRRLIAGLNTVLLSSLNGGSGATAGVVSFTNRANQTKSIDFSPARSLSDVIDLINAETDLGFTAAVNKAGNGLMLTDTTGGDGPLIVQDVSGSLAQNLGIAVAFDPINPFTGSVINGGNTQLQYVSRQTALSALNFGKGIPAGSFRITDATGQISVVKLSATAQTVGQVLDAINAQTPDHITARLNDTGDGIALVDESGGTALLLVEDLDGSQTAAALRLAGQSKPGTNLIDGSYEITIEVGAADTLKTLAEKINKAGGGLSASIFNAGGSLNAFSLTITSGVAGKAGQLVIDTAGVDLGFDTLSKAQDALITLGGAGAGVLISSGSNTIEKVIEGVTIHLVGTGDQEVALNVSQDVEAIVKNIQQFVQAYNEVQASIDQSTRFNPESFQKGPLFGDPTIPTVRNRLQAAFFKQFPQVPAVASYLFKVGLQIGKNHRLEFDAEKFQQAYQEHGAEVEQLFTAEQTGFGQSLEAVLEELTTQFDGTLALKDNLLKDKQQVLTKKIEQMNKLLEAKRKKLEAQFASLEASLANLQEQQNTLGQMTNLFKSGK